MYGLLGRLLGSRREKLQHDKQHSNPAKPKSVQSALPFRTRTVVSLPLPSWRVRGLLPRALVWGLTGIASACTVLGFAGKWWWHFELASHFRVQWLVLLAAAMPV